MLFGSNFFAGRQQAAVFVGEYRVGTRNNMPMAGFAVVATDMQIGDLMVVTYYRPGRTIGGAGGPFTTYQVNDLGVSWRVVEAADLVSSAITFSDVTPIGMNVWRGPRLLGPSRSTANITTLSGTIPGFAPSPGMMGLFAGMNVGSGDASIAGWTERQLGEDGTYFTEGASLENGQLYNGDGIPLTRTAGGSGNYGHVGIFEMLAF